MDSPNIYLRVSDVLTRNGPQPERHVFRDISGQIAVALCQHFAFTDKLRDDDPDVVMCPLCAVFHAADEEARARTVNMDMPEIVWPSSEEAS